MSTSLAVLRSDRRAALYWTRVPLVLWISPKGLHSVDCNVKFGLDIREDAGRPPSGAKACHSSGQSKIRDLDPHLALVKFKLLLLFLGRALHKQTLLLHLARNINVLGLLGGKARHSKGHSLAVSGFGRALKVLNNLRQMGLGQGTKLRGLSPKLSELQFVTVRGLGLEGLSLPTELGGLSSGALEGRLGALQGSLRGRLRGMDLRVKSDALGLQCSNFVGKGL